MSETFWKTFIVSLRQLRSPMRPDASELAAVMRILEDGVATRPGDGRVPTLVLGLTTPFAEADWPERIEVSVVERSEAMVREFWSTIPRVNCKLIVGDWRDRSLLPRGFDYVLGDGVFNLQDYPQGFTGMAETISGLIAPAGLAIIRVFVQPDRKESPEEVIEEYRTGDIRDFQQLRFRVATALQARPEDGIRVNPLMLDREMASRGVNLDSLYRDMTNVLPRLRQDALDRDPYLLKTTYPTRKEFEEAIAPHLSVIEIRHGTHALASRCPIYCLVAAGA